MLQNKYVQRWAVSSDARPCFICYRPTTCVMVNETPKADFFYACETHLKDPGFATIEKSCQEALKRKEEKSKEIELLKKQWASLQEKKEKSKSSSEKPESQSPEPPMPTQESPSPVTIVYELNRGVFNLRVGTKKRALQEKKTKSILETPGLFPKVPTHKPQ